MHLWLRLAVWKCKLIQNKGQIFWHHHREKSKSPRPRFLFIPPGLLLQIIWSKTILNYPSLIALPSNTLDFKIPQELLIIKSLISPDSEESILLSYLISICIMPPVSQSYTFEVKELEENSKSLFSPSFLVEATVIISETQRDNQGPTLSYWWELIEWKNQHWFSDSLSEDSQPHCTYSSVGMCVGGLGIILAVQHRTGLCGTTRTQWIMSSLCDVCCRGEWKLSQGTVLKHRLPVKNHTDIRRYEPTSWPPQLLFIIFARGWKDFTHRLVFLSLRNRDSFDHKIFFNHV